MEKNKIIADKKSLIIIAKQHFMVDCSAET
jgi:hypothetical protein